MAKSELTTKECIDCGKKFETAFGSRSVRCRACQKEHVLAYKRVYDRQRYAKEKEQREIEKVLYPKAKKREKPVKDTSTVCDKTKECYYGEEAGKIYICNYLEITKCRRPCPPTNCYMFKRKENVDGGCEK